MTRKDVINNEKITLGRTKEFSCREFEKILNKTNMFIILTI